MSTWDLDPAHSEIEFAGNGALESGGVLVGDEVKITMDVALVQAAAVAATEQAGVA